MLASPKNGERQGTTLSFHDIRYHVTTKGPGCCAETEKEIIKGVSGFFECGMNAILGPTGSGKTSLLDIAAKRKDPRGLSGQILVDGQPQSENFKCHTGYVVQDDNVRDVLTVRENFMFSANLRLRKSLTHEEKMQKADDVIKELGLTRCADTKVGDEFSRGISGGERKRTNIGMELIISPEVLFLDEPTTGLDASTANAVMLLLHNLSRNGRTIIFSIHQPRFTIFRLFDRLMLLSLGKTVYHGPAEDALQYFSDIGYVCEEHNNPPDFFLDVVNGDSSALDGLHGKTIDWEPVIDYNTEGCKNNGFVRDTGTLNSITFQNGNTPSHVVVPLDEPAPGEGALADELAKKFKDSALNKTLEETLQPIWAAFQESVKSGTTSELKRRGEYAISSFWQVVYLCKLNAVNLLRNPQGIIGQIITAIVVSLLVGILFLGIDSTPNPGIQNRVGSFFFIIMNLVFSHLSAIEIFIQQRGLFIHENGSGFYRVFPYFIAKVIPDSIMLRLVPLLFFAPITYFMIGFQLDVGKFFFYFLNNFLTTMTASSIAFCVSASTKIFAIANLILSLIYVLMMIFAGFLVNLSTMPVWLNWLQYFSLYRYSLRALLINEMKDFDFCTVMENGTAGPCVSGNSYLDQQGINYETAWDLWQNEFALACFLLGFMTLTLIQLSAIKKWK